MEAVTSHASPLFVVPMAQQAGGPGWFAITLAPGKRTWGTFVHWDRDLAVDLDRLVALHTTTLVPLLPDDELASLGIEALESEATRRGLAVIRFPFEDNGVPDSVERTATLVDDLCDRLSRGERLVAHCNGGLGRAGIIAACVRLRTGLDGDAAEAIRSVRRLRSERAVENRAQERFIATFDGWRRTHPRPASIDGREPEPGLAARLGVKEDAA